MTGISDLSDLTAFSILSLPSLHKPRSILWDDLLSLQGFAAVIAKVCDQLAVSDIGPHNLIDTGVSTKPFLCKLVHNSTFVTGFPDFRNGLEAECVKCR